MKVTDILGCIVYVKLNHRGGFVCFICRGRTASDPCMAGVDEPTRFRCTGCCNLDRELLLCVSFFANILAVYLNYTVIIKINPSCRNSTPFVRARSRCARPLHACRLGRLVAQLRVRPGHLLASRVYSISKSRVPEPGRHLTSTPAETSGTPPARPPGADHAVRPNNVSHTRLFPSALRGCGSLFLRSGMCD